MDYRTYLRNYPDQEGRFGPYGGAYLSDELKPAFEEISEAYQTICHSSQFINELRRIRREFQGRPTPVYHCERLSNMYGNCQIYLKREDLNHTGAHKLNHCMGEGLLAKFMGKTRMKILGANVVPVTHGLKTLKEAVDSAFDSYAKNYKDSIYCIGSALGPHPFPLMVRDFQSVVGYEAKEQFIEMTGLLPDVVCACVGGGSNSIGMFIPFVDEPVDIVGVEPLGRGSALGDHAASMTYGEKGVMHGFESIMLKDRDGEPAPVYSIASGLDYPSVGPEHAFLNDLGRVSYETADDEAAMKAFFELSRYEGIIPAIESSHAVAYAKKKAQEMKKGSILVCLSGRGDKDIDYVVENYGYGEKYL